MDTEELKDHFQKVKELAGKRIKILDYICAPEGWVVARKVPDIFWKSCKTYSFPVQAERIFGILPSTATKEQRHWIKKYGKNIMFVVLPNKEEGFGHHHSGGPIFLDDLKKDPDTLLNESFKEADIKISKMKSRAAMVMFT